MSALVAAIPFLAAVGLHGRGQEASLTAKTGCAGQAPAGASSADRLAAFLGRAM